MRLSEIRGERVFDVIAEIIEPACNIAQDECAARLFERNRPEGMEPKDYALEKVKTSMPVLLRNHKSDMVAILSAIEGVDADEYMRDLTIPKLISGVYVMLTDEDLLAFFS